MLLHCPASGLLQSVFGYNIWLTLKPSGYICTTRFNIQKFYALLIDCACFALISERTSIISLHIYRLIFKTETECVYYAVRAESLNKIKGNLIFQLGFPCQYHSTIDPSSSSSTCCLGQTEEAWNLPTSNALLGIGEHWIESTFTWLVLNSYLRLTFLKKIRIFLRNIEMYP
jgi:hypothetical protein